MSKPETDSKIAKIEVVTSAFDGSSEGAICRMCIKCCKFCKSDRCGKVFCGGTVVIVADVRDQRLKPLPESRKGADVI